MQCFREKGSQPIQQMLLSFVFSFRNEEENITELVGRVEAAVTGIEDLVHEMIFVNDDSTDRSLEILLKLQEEHPITIINMSRPFGVTPCVLAGLAYARGDAVVYMDADLQDPPEIVPQMVQLFRNGAEVVHTTRAQRDGESGIKMWVTKKAYRIINYFSDIHLPENTGDFKLLSRKVVQEVLKLTEDDPYMRGLSVWVGYRQEFVLYRRSPRFKGRTKFPLLSKGPVFEFLRGITAFSAGPLYISFFLGLITCLFSASLILYAIVTKLVGVAAPGASGVLIAVALFSGIVLVTNGILGLYVARIYREVKRRPRYVIRDVIQHGQSTD
jgi:glycosyltransferase involved in cell wall biosynthesis